MHRVFISYHHQNDQSYKDRLVEIGEHFGVFIDKSVAEDDIDDSWSDEKIRKIVRDQYLRDSTVTILLAGIETKYRKHIDWEIYSSMYDGQKNKKSGVLVIDLPTSRNSSFRSVYGNDEKNLIYPDITGWETIHHRSEYEKRYPDLPKRIIDNLLAPNVKISIVPWNRINTTSLEFLIDSAYRERSVCQYDLKRQMMRRNS